MKDALIIYALTRAALERALAEPAIACGEEQVFLCAAVEEKEDVEPIEVPFECRSLAKEGTRDPK